MIWQLLLLLGQMQMELRECPLAWTSKSELAAE